MTRIEAIRLANAIISAWDNWDKAANDETADSLLNEKIDAAREALAGDVTFADWFAPALEWQVYDDMSNDELRAANDYTMDEAVEVLRVLTTGREDCDVLAILNACPWAIKRTAIK